MATSIFNYCSLLFLFLLLFPFLTLSERCNPSDKKALLQLKKDLHNPYILASWNPKDDCCDWYCVKCDEKTNRIISLDISSSVPDTDFSAQIPDSIANLPYLQYLEFHKLPKLTGPLNPAIAKLTRLTFLRIDYTNLSGPIPDFLAQLKNLDLIILSHNNLSGPIPASLSQLPKLGSLQLDHNKLTGPIPDSFGYFKSSPDLWLHNNQLSGKIPASLAKQNTTRILLQRNKLEGDASMLFSAKKTTEQLDISRNMLSFDVSKVGFARTLIYLDMNHNKIYGKLPEGLNAVENLQAFNGLIGCGAAAGGVEPTTEGVGVGEGGSRGFEALGLAAATSDANVSQGTFYMTCKSSEVERKAPNDPRKWRRKAPNENGGV
ncbi:polygalacturonase inhibitor-like [Senna tora]|uniref:Polygalacturonase inhibitor-like n=1 Tax=Senna tora TaxID=362788 RepID=A0A834SNN7_9FABA|nr:polygalacturonase inhibitor-like [Senna tora]